MHVFARFGVKLEKIKNARFDWLHVLGCSNKINGLQGVKRVKRAKTCVKRLATHLHVFTETYSKTFRVTLRKRASYAFVERIK
tara:strand:- start:1449 stop:1697 length:249 start_codon:yes stop_codon:yes gene_type:complete